MSHHTFNNDAPATKGAAMVVPDTATAETSSVELAEVTFWPGA